ncbi:MAG: hypothetical protein IPM21_10890 [Acidobacteria bacterium]|nr:hypothetical protein [Acidobacteriota bacterium]
MKETNDFFNDGFGWVCRHCHSELSRSASDESDSLSRLMTEGEAEAEHRGLPTRSRQNGLTPNAALMCFAMRHHRTDRHFLNPPSVVLD